MRIGQSVEVRPCSQICRGVRFRMVIKIRWEVRGRVELRVRDSAWPRGYSRVYHLRRYV